MKKIFFVSALTALLLLLTACGEGSRLAEDTAQTPVSVTLSPEEEEERKIEDIISGMTLEEKVWQMFMVAPEDIIDVGAVTNAGEITKKAISDYPVGGFIYFAKNIETYDQTAALIRNMQSYSKIPLFIAVDEEGGRVARLGNADIGVTKFPPMREIGDSGDTDKAAQVGETIGKELTALGFNVDFAPVADVITVENNEDIGDRSFGEDPYLVADMVAAEVKAMQEQNLSSTLKHFPSNGSTAVNTHKAAGVCTRTLSQMRETEFVPFKAGIDAGADFVMAAHMAVPDITGDETPSTLSSVTINDLLRGELGFSNIVVSDALNMGAITSQYTAEEAAVKAVKAGVDILLMSTDPVASAKAVTEAVNSGEIEQKRIDESLERILRIKIKRGLIK